MPEDKVRSRGDSIKTRIETELGVGIVGVVVKVREAIPLKQGLKHRYVSVCIMALGGSRGDSIKTRIETDNAAIIQLRRDLVREAIPLKQGLKLPGQGGVREGRLLFERRFH